LAAQAPHHAAHELTAHLAADGAQHGFGEGFAGGRMATFVSKSAPRRAKSLPIADEPG
jgi:hypothetical protein